MIAKVQHHVGYRGSCLLVFAVVDLVSAYALAWSPANTATNRWFDQIVPLWGWAIVWVVVGAVVAVAAFGDHYYGGDRIGFSVAIGIKVVWGMGCFAGWILADVPPSATAIWLGFAFLVWRISGWPEPPMIGKTHGHES